MIASSTQLVTTALRGWVKGLGYQHNVETRVDEDLMTGGVRVTVFTTAGGTLRANFVRIPYDQLMADDVRSVCENVREGVISLLCQLTPPRNGGAFTQEDAIKLQGVRDVSRVHRRRR